MRTLIVIAAALLLYFILRWQYRKNPARFTKKLLYWGGILFLVGLLLLVATGRLHWLSAVVAGLVAVAGKAFSLLRYLPILRSIRSALGLKNTAQERFSRLESRYFKMALNPQSGEMDGLVLEGEFQGRKLSDLDSNELQQLWHECQQQDHESALLLAAYLSRYYKKGHFHTQDFAGQSEGGASDAMSRAQALDILGLTDPVEEKEVIQAHRRLMQKFHPDRGGSNYLAVKINAAKEFLLQHQNDC